MKLIQVKALSVALLALLVTKHAFAAEPTAHGYVASGEVGDFILPSVLRVLPNIQSPKPLTIGGLAKNEIAITVDDGPTLQTTPAILKIFKDHGVKATFFLVGNRIKAHPELVRMILEAGHSVANHTMSHPHMESVLAKGENAVANEIDPTQDLLEREGHAVGIPIQPFFRFPFGEGANNPRMQAMLQKRNLGNFYWQMSAHDSRTQDPTVALNTSVGMIDKYNRGIFLVHETHPAGLKMLPYFLKELAKRNYTTIYYQAEGFRSNVNP